MARFRRTGGFARGAKSTRQIENLAITGLFDGITTIAGFIKQVGTFGVAATQAETWIRVRGHFASKLVAGAPSGNSIIRGALGIIKVSSDAFAIGASALPGPLTDTQNDWVMYLPFVHLVQSADDEAIALGANISLPFDSRGMRKAKIGDLFAVMLEYESDTAGSVFDAGYVLRVQSKT